MLRAAILDEWAGAVWEEARKIEGLLASVTQVYKYLLAKQ